MKEEFYERVVMPTLTHGTESWGMSKTERRKRKVMEMKCSRCVYQVMTIRMRNVETMHRVGESEKICDR